ncbi:MAG: PBECR2 nuclease fold domain-containing protein [Candidatus Pacearchaeota archaeon]
MNIFEIKDKTGREIYLTKERWRHVTSPISPHAYMTNYIEYIKETLTNPYKIISDMDNPNKAYYFRYHKDKKEYLKIVVNYLNGRGFIITSYFVRNIR